MFLLFLFFPIFPHSPYSSRDSYIFIHSKGKEEIIRFIGDYTLDKEIERRAKYILAISRMKKGNYRDALSFLQDGLTLSTTYEDSLFILKALITVLLKLSDKRAVSFINNIKEPLRSFFLSLENYKNGKVEKAVELIRPFYSFSAEFLYTYLFFLNSLKRTEELEIKQALLEEKHYLFPFLVFQIAYQKYLSGDFKKSDSLLVVFFTSPYPFLLLDDALLLHSIVLEKSGKIEKSTETLLYLINTLPESEYVDYARIKSAIFLREKKRFEAAKEVLLPLVQKNSMYKRESLLEFIRISSGLKNFDEVMKNLLIYKNSFGEDKDYRDVLLFSANACFRAGFYKECEEIVENFFTDSLDYIKIFPQYILSLLKQEKIERAREIINKEKSISLKSKGSFLIAEFYEKKGNFISAYYFFNHAYKTEIDKEIKSKYFLKREMTAYRMGWYIDAIHVYKKFLQKFGNTSQAKEVKKLLIEEYNRRKEYNNSLVYIDELIEDPVYKDWAIKTLFEIYFKKREIEKIDSLYNVYRDKESLKSWIVVNVGKFYLKKIQDPFLSLKILKDVVQFDAKDNYKRIGLHLLGECFFILNRLDESEELFLRNYEEKRDSIGFSSILYLVQIWRKKEQYNKIDSLLSKEIELWEGKRKAALLYEFALIKERKEEKELARDIFLTAADLFSSSPDSLALCLYKSALLSDSREEKTALLLRAMDIADDPFLKKEIEKLLIDIKED